MFRGSQRISSAKMVTAVSRGCRSHHLGLLSLIPRNTTAESMGVLGFLPAFEHAQKGHMGHPAWHEGYIQKWKPLLVPPTPAPLLPCQVLPTSPCLIGLISGWHCRRACRPLHPLWGTVPTATATVRSLSGCRKRTLWYVYDTRRQQYTYTAGSKCNRIGPRVRSLVLLAPYWPVWLAAAPQSFSNPKDWTFTK